MLKLKKVLLAMMVIGFAVTSVISCSDDSKDEETEINLTGEKLYGSVSTSVLLNLLGKDYSSYEKSLPESYDMAELNFTSKKDVTLKHTSFAPEDDENLTYKATISTITIGEGDEAVVLKKDGDSYSAKINGTIDAVYKKTAGRPATNFMTDIQKFMTN